MDPKTKNTEINIPPVRTFKTLISISKKTKITEFGKG
jgi:hypothetical protein